MLWDIGRTVLFSLTSIVALFFLTKMIGNRQDGNILQHGLAAAVLATLIGGNAWAATYDRGLTGSTDDQKWLQNGTVTESDGVVTYKLDGANHAFQSGEEDTAALYVQGKKVVLAGADTFRASART